jgi:hypothetical protein
MIKSTPIMININNFKKGKAIVVYNFSAISTPFKLAKFMTSAQFHLSHTSVFTIYHAETIKNIPITHHIKKFIHFFCSSSLSLNINLYPHMIAKIIQTTIINGMSAFCAIHIIKSLAGSAHTPETIPVSIAFTSLTLSSISFSNLFSAETKLIPIKAKNKINIDNSFFIFI